MKKKIAIAGILAALTPFAALADAAKDALDGLGASGKQAGIDTSSSVAELIGTVIKAGLSLVGVVFLVLTVYGGFIWMIARGDEGKVETAKDTLTRAIIGLIIVVGAYAITSFVVRAFTK